MTTARIPAIEDTTASYEAWLEAQTPAVQADLDVKHRRMSKDPCTFLRGTFDLHTENFWTWRDWDGRLVWRTNDFDEACLLLSQ